MFKQHIPNYVDSDPKTSDASTTLDVLSLEWVDRYTKHTDHVFYMWTCDGRTLITLYDNGAYWWVVGYADFDLDLPKFRDHRIERQAEVAVLAEGLCIRSDGKAWYLLRPNESKTGYLGYRVDTKEWLPRMYTAFRSELEAQMAKDVL